jgi:Tfp pilus assembly protein PilX
LNLAKLGQLEAKMRFNKGQITARQRLAKIDLRNRGAARVATPFTRGNDRGYALLIVMTFMGIMLVLFAAMMFDTLSNANITKRNNQYNASQTAAQSATEKVLSQMTHDFEFESLSNNGSYYGTTFVPTLAQDESDWPVQYAFSDTNNTTNQISVNIGAVSAAATSLDSQYSGLYGFVQNCTLSATATPLSGPAVSATVTESIQFALIPLFQFAIFYNMNLEIAAAQTLNIVGPVYSNGGLWSGATTITFSSTVSAVGLATNSADDPFCSGYSGSGKSKYSVAGQPTSGNDTITMPIGTNNNPVSVEAIVNIPPGTYQMGTSAAFTTNGQLYLANEADLFLTNSATGTNFGSLEPVGNSMALYYQDSVDSPNYMTWMTNDFYMFSNRVASTYHVYWTNALPIHYYYTNNLSAFKWTNNPAGTNQLFFAGYSFLTNVLFYDAREGWHGGSGPAKTVQAVQIDLQKFNVWLTNSVAINPNSGTNLNALCNSSNHKSHPMDSIYIFNGVPLTPTTLPAARIVNGGILPTVDGGFGFTLATAQPLYIWGDYNAWNSAGSSLSQNSVNYTEPAGLMADAITILSDNWSDSTTSGRFSGGPAAATTTINAACLEGIVESNPNNRASNANGYSGGVENFLRLLENWGSSRNLYYNGSIIVMFPSQYATNCWQQTGGYYTAPNRHWAFDTNFASNAGLPPMTPRSQGVIRGSWSVQ